ncbi:MAG: AsmA family protein, partial [Burkholderiales bacterium]
MSFRLPSIKTLAISLAGLLVAYALFGWLIFPRILESQAIRYISEKTGHHLSLDRPEFNPFTLSLRISNLHLQKPDGKQLLAFRMLTVELSPASIFKRALVFNAIQLDDPEATLVLKPDGRLNWSQLIDSLDGKEAKAANKRGSQLPRINIQTFGLKGGRIDFADEKTGFATRISPMDLELRDISTFPNDKGRYRISARTSFGALVKWQGQAMLNPLSVDGSLSVENLDLSPLKPYFRNVLLNAPPAGVASVSTDYHISYADNQPNLVLKNLTGKLSDFRIGIGGKKGPHISIKTIEAKNGDYDLARNRIALGSLSLSGSRINLPSSGGAVSELLQLEKLTLVNTTVDLSKRSIALDHVDFTKGLLHVARNAKGRINLVDALHAAMPLQEPEKKSQGRWRFRVNRLELGSFAVSF